MAMNQYLGKKEKSGFVQFVRLLSSVEEKIDELATIPSTDKQYEAFADSENVAYEGC